MIKKLTLFLFLILLVSTQLRAESSFYPEAESDLVKEGVWVKTSFKKGETAGLTVFRAYFPYEADKVWPLLIDSNGWKKIHSEFKDVFTLSKSEADLIESKNPKTVKEFYDLIGTPSHPYDIGRKKGSVWTSYAFERFNFPWPLTDRWAVVEINNDETKAAKGEYRYEYKTLGGNFKWLKGYWVLLPHPTKQGWTEFRGEYKSDPGIDVPHFLAKSVVKSSIKSNLKENIAELAKRFGAANK